MILLGRVYEGLMVDRQAVNRKLLRRSEDMLLRLTGCSREEAREALRLANGSVKLSMLLLHGCDLNRAQLLLHRAGGRLRLALELMAKRDSDAA